MSAEQLDAQERSSFLDWRRELARLEEDEKLVGGVARVPRLCGGWCWRCRLAYSTSASPGRALARGLAASGGAWRQAPALAPGAPAGAH
jgi:hypothetical protein